MLDGADTTVGAVADEGRGLVHPLGGEPVDGVLQHTRDPEVVLGGHEDKGIALVNGAAPRPNGLGIVLAVGQQRRDGRVVQGQVETGQIEQNELDIVPLRDVVQHPAGDRSGVAPPADRTFDDTNLHSDSFHLQASYATQTRSPAITRPVPDPQMLDLYNLTSGMSLNMI